MVQASVITYISNQSKMHIKKGEFILTVTGTTIEPATQSVRKYGKDAARFIRILKKAIASLIEKSQSFRPSILASLERFKAESSEQDRQCRSVRKSIKDRERVHEGNQQKSR